MKFFKIFDLFFRQEGISKSLKGNIYFKHFYNLIRVLNVPVKPKRLPFTCRLRIYLFYKLYDLKMTFPISNHGEGSFQSLQLQF